MDIDPEEKEIIPEDHKLILNERLLKYAGNSNDVINWEDLRKELWKDL